MSFVNQDYLILQEETAKFCVVVFISGTEISIADVSL